MHDIRFIRENPKAFAERLNRRGPNTITPEQLKDIQESDNQHRRFLAQEQQANSANNAISAEVSVLQAKRNLDSFTVSPQSINESEIAEKKEQAKKFKQEAAKAREKARDCIQRRDDLISKLPNLPHESVPDGEGEGDNPVLREAGKKPASDFAPREHFDLGEALGYMDFGAAAKISGARFAVLKGPLARLERALGQFMLDVAVNDFGYAEVSTPSLVNDGALFGTGQLPKFAADQFRTEQGLWLIPTAEVTLSNLRRDEIVAEEELPLRFAALTPCYRAEAGAAGKDTRGMIRVHEFQKVELVSITTLENSLKELKRKTKAAEAVLKKLGLPYRVVELCTGELGFAARKTYDIEVWLPGQKRYREISSVSDCGDFQARRMNMRCRKKGEKETRFPHTLNGSGVAVGRCLVAVMENYQEPDGSIRLPEALQPYMGGLTKIAKA